MDNYVFGVDIGGTTVKIGLFGTDGTLCEIREIPTRTEHNGAEILGDISGSIRDMISGQDLAQEQILGIGMGVPGPVDREGTVNKCVNLGWGVFNVEQEMQELLGFKTKASNDANAAALGEMWMGGGKGYRDIVMITLGTGIGGGVIIDGKIVPGFNGAAGEIGHFTVNEDEPEACACGKHGCLEQYASANGVVRMAKKFLKEHDDETILRGNMIDEITSKEVFDAAKEGDPVALQLVENFGKMLGKALAHTACVINPQVFVIGGGVSKAGDIVLDVIRKYFVQYAFHASRGTLFKLAVLGNKAGMFGGARMILDETENV
ncbi:MAG: ROK family glucokinase [Lachnospiraceae bacterium]|nr:ROK family glucokinase [Lachnospiraceae bacterium]